MNNIEYNKQYILFFRSGIFIGIIDEKGDIYLNNPNNPGTRIYHSNIKDGYLLKYKDI